MDEACELERRLISEAPTLDINRDDNGRTVIRGYAAVYQSDSKNLGGFVERLSEGCFDDVLASNPDVFARFNHSDDMILGRTTAGTLRLFADEKGLRYEIDPPRSAAGLVESLERGDIRNSSFAFRVKPQDEAWTRDATGLQIRTINRIDSLHDVAVVANPAYSAAEAFVSKRALSMVTPADESPAHETEEAFDLTPANVALHEATEAIAEAVGKWPQSGPNGAHYMPESPFAATGMRCANCVMYEGGGRCEAVEGEIEADGVCKLWVIPAGKLDMTRSIALSKAAGLNALLLSNALHQSTGKR